MNKTEESIELERYIRQIDNDLKNFSINKRFIILEKAWIACVSHRVFKNNKLFVHDDRKKLRNKLMRYLDKKVKEKNLKEKFSGKRR